MIDQLGQWLAAQGIALPSDGDLLEASLAFALAVVALAVGWQVGRSIGEKLTALWAEHVVADNLEGLAPRMAAISRHGSAALLLGRRPALPPAYVLYVGAFYVLTPGSHGLRGIESWIGGDRIQGLTSVGNMVGLLVAIAVGMLVAAAAVGAGEHAVRRNYERDGMSARRTTPSGS